MIRFIDSVDISNKRVLLRVDYNVPFNPDDTVRDQTRIIESLPTLQLLLSKNNKIILVSHRGRPKGRDEKLSLKPVADILQSYLKNFTIVFIPDFLKESGSFIKQQASDILFLENIRFYAEEQANDSAFTHSLADLADVYVNDAFSVNHRESASITGITKLLPSYGGLLLRKEIDALQKIVHAPKMPFIAILGGAKISTKLTLIDRLLSQVSQLLLAGGLGNTLLLAQGIQIGKSITEPDMLTEARKILMHANNKILLPVDAIVGKSIDESNPIIKPINSILEDDWILDIGPETRNLFAQEIAKANTLIWNGPMGYFENPLYKKGSDAICQAITSNEHVTAIVGGGETLNAISGNPHLDKIYHVSTGGGAMIEYIEKATLPGIQALENSQA